MNKNPANQKTKDNKQEGATLVEFAIFLPVFIILTFALIGFGYIFVIYEAEGRTVTTAAQAISSATPPSNPASWSPITWSEAAAFGKPLIDFPAPNPKTGPTAGQPTICAQSYATQAEAQTALTATKPCDKDTWDAKPPTGWTSGNWYVLVQAKVTPSLPIPDLYSWMVTLPLTQTAVATVTSPTSIPIGWVKVNGETANTTDPDTFCQSNGYKGASGMCYLYDDVYDPYVARHYGFVYYAPMRNEPHFHGAITECYPSVAPSQFQNYSPWYMQCLN